MSHLYTCLLLELRMGLCGDTFKKILSIRSRSRSRAASSFGYSYETRRDPFGSDCTRQVWKSCRKKRSGQGDEISNSLDIDGDEKVWTWTEGTTTSMEPSGDSGPESRYWKRIRKRWGWGCRKRLGQAAASPRFPSFPHACNSSDQKDVPPTESSVRSLHVKAQDSKCAFRKTRQTKLPRKGVVKTRGGSTGGSSKNENNDKQKVKTFAHLMGVVSNRDVLSCIRKQGPNTVAEQKDGSSDRRSAEAGLLDLGAIRDTAGEKQDDQLGTEGVASKRGVAPSKAIFFHRPTSKFGISSLRSLKNTRKDAELVRPSDLDRPSSPNATDSNEWSAESLNWTHVSGMNMDDALQRGLEDRGGSQRDRNDSFGKKRAGSCPASSRHYTHGSESSPRPCRRGHNRQISVDEWRSLTLGSLRGLGHRKSKRTGRLSDFESPWGVKDDAQSEGQSLESRQASKSFLRVNMSDILLAVNNGLKTRREDSDGESDFLVSDDTLEGEEGSRKKRKEGESAEIEMFQDPFVEYTIRAKQGANRTFADRFKRKSTVS